MKIIPRASNWLVFIMSMLCFSVVNAAGSSIGANFSKSSMYIDEAAVPSFDSGSALSLNASLSLDKWFVVPGFSIETEYSKSMAPISYEFNNVVMTREDEFLFRDTLIRNYEHQTLGGYIAFDFLSTQTLVLKTRFGYVYSRASDNTLVSCSGECDTRQTPPVTIGGVNATPNSLSLNGSGISLGLSLSYVFFKHIYGTVEFTRLRINYAGQSSEYGMTYVSVGLGFTM